MLSASFIAKKPLKFVTAAAAVLLSAGTENLASHSESIKAHTGQVEVHALKLNLNLQRGIFWPKKKAADNKAHTGQVEVHALKLNLNLQRGIFRQKKKAADKATAEKEKPEEEREVEQLPSEVVEKLPSEVYVETMRRLSSLDAPAPETAEYDEMMNKWYEETPRRC